MLSCVYRVIMTNFQKSNLFSIKSIISQAKTFSIIKFSIVEYFILFFIKLNKLEMINHMNENFQGVGDRISLKIKQLELKQIEVSAKIGISKNALSNYISGKRLPDTLAIYKLAKFFSVSIEWLLTGIHSEVEVQKNTSDEEDLLSLFRKLPYKEQLKAIGYLESKVDDLNSLNKKDKLSNSTHGEENVTNETG